jgi:hypothetical protein
MEKRFRALRTIGTLFKVLAWIDLVAAILGAIGVGIAGLLGALSGLAQGSDLPKGMELGSAVAGLGMAVGILIAGLIYFLLLYAAAEGIYVVLAIEENTRRAAVALSGKASF